MGAVPGEPQSISVPQAARLWDVRRQTAHKWFRDGTVAGAKRVGHGFRAPESAVRQAKVLLPSDLEAKFGIPRARLAEAERSGQVRSYEGRFSLDDLDVLRGRGARPSASRSLTPEKRLALLRDLVKREAPFAEYPDELFDTATCPLFYPPKVGLFAYAIGEFRPDRERPIGVWIARSGGWELGPDGEPHWREPTARAHWVRPATDELPAEMAASTWLFREYEIEWQNEWRRRRRPVDGKVTNV